MPCWYFDKAELVNTPSFRDGIDSEREARYRREGARFLMGCGNNMGLRYDTMATGVVFFHRFYMFHSFNEFPRFIMAACCLFLAGKVEETPKKCKDIVRASKSFSEATPEFKKCTDSFTDETIKELMTYEKILLQTIKFDLQVDHPYGYLLKYAKTLKGDQEQIRAMVQMAWTFINDSYSTTICLQWEPEIIAIALMHLTSKMSKFEITDWIDKKESSFKQNWWDQFVEDLDIQILEDICHQILDLYARPKQEVQPKQSTLVHQNSTSSQNGCSTNSQNTLSNKRKSPPDTTSLTPTLSSVGYNEPASPTSAKLMKTLNEPPHYQGYQMGMNQSYFNESYHYQIGQPLYNQPPPPPPPNQPNMMPPYQNFGYFPPGNPSMSLVPPQYAPYPSQQKTYNMHQFNMAPGAPVDSINHPYHHVQYNGHKEQSHVNINGNKYNSTASVSSTSSSSTSNSQLRSSALKTVNITDR